MDLFASDHIRPLHIAENRLLEVLVSRYSLKRQGLGSKLDVHFDEDTPAIWSNKGRNDVRRMIHDFEGKSSDYQQRLDRFLLESEGNDFEFNDPSFPFRYASGGALPVLRFGLKEYYCLFYRMIFPVGWNIANGGCDTRNELLNPVDTIERELREELTVVDPKKKFRYSFEFDAGKSLDRPEFAVARYFWRKRFHELDFPDFEELVIPLKWIDGPDYLRVQFGNDEPKTLSGFFLNINAKDLGIEIDKVAKLNLDEDVILCDGEIRDGRLLNRIVGLFEVDKLNQGLLAGKTEFLPDIFFYDAERYDKNVLQGVIYNNCIPRLATIYKKEEMEQYISSHTRFDLCPVTRRIISRYLSLKTKRPLVPEGPFDVFISFGSEDSNYAEKVFNFLTQKKNTTTFFSKETISNPDFLKAIDDALDSANCLIAVATSPDYMRKSWVEYEYRSFYHDMLNGRKSNAKLVSFISGFHPAELPRPLRFCEAVTFTLDNIESAFEDLAKYVPS